MRHRWKLSKVAVTVLLVVLFFAPLGLFMAGVRNVQTIDNRALSKWPGFTISDLVDTGYYAKLKTYLVDRFPFRPEIIRLRGQLLQDYIGDFNNDRIVWGRDNWMFLRQAIRFSCDKPDLVARAVRGMRVFSDYLRSLGKDVTFMIAPNKSTIYPDKVARRFESYLGCENRHRRLFHLMLKKQPSISYLDAFAPTRAARKRWPNGVYHWFDVHWDCRGSEVLAKLIIRDFYGDPARNVPVEFFLAPRKADISIVLGRPFKVAGQWMSCRSKLRRAKIKRIDDGKDRYFYSYKTIGGAPLAPGAKTHALIIHDSFANGLRRMVPQLIPTWTMYNVNNRDYKKLAKAIRDADKVYVEIVERSAFVNFARLGHPRFMKLLKEAMSELQ